ncbi:hypothetical protein Nepgr_021416 [Nepenthes gracilis]|uniref:Uncharacterized protein n=1 Tax=Nepenthes gracilis TaxID=150966 RepID=A0AAD3XX71_NEPGR|nr:hypothetical protein Nepgr_021416 [Nepenthes gracilis]
MLMAGCLDTVENGLLVGLNLCTGLMDCSWHPLECSCCLWPALPFMLFPLIPSCVALPIIVSSPAASAADIALREGLFETRYSSDLLCCARYIGRWALDLGNVLLILNV